MGTFAINFQVSRNGVPFPLTTVYCSYMPACSISSLLCYTVDLSMVSRPTEYVPYLSAAAWSLDHLLLVPIAVIIRRNKLQTCITAFTVVNVIKPVVMYMYIASFSRVNLVQVVAAIDPNKLLSPCISCILIPFLSAPISYKHRHISSCTFVNSILFFINPI